MGEIVLGCIVPHPPILLPEIAYGQEAKIASTSNAMAQLSQAMAKSQPQTLLVISPHGASHYDAMGVVNSGETAGNFDGWGASGLDFRYPNDLDFVNALRQEAKALDVPLTTMGETGYELDHGVLVPMYFISRAVRDVSLAPLTFSWLSLNMHFKFGQAIRKAVEKIDRRVAIVASGDLSHRLVPGAPAGFDPMGKVFDRRIVDDITAMNVESILNIDHPLSDRAGECGLRSIVILLGALDGLKVQQQVLSYEGPFGVGYMVATFGIGPGQRDPLVDLARQTVECYITSRSIPKLEPDLLTDEMKERAGVFVCLKKSGDLRGCIGTFEPTRANVAEEIVSNAISSATRDPRFMPVNPSELADVTYSVDVLAKPEPVDSPDKLDAKKYGVIVEAGGRRGLLLPDLEGVNTVQQQIAICRQKAGIGPNEPVKLYRFEVRRHE